MISWEPTAWVIMFKTNEAGNQWIWYQDPIKLSFL